MPEPAQLVARRGSRAGSSSLHPLVVSHGLHINTEWRKKHDSCDSNHVICARSQGRRCSRGLGEDGQVITRMTPILPVTDVRGELAFYERLGFSQYVDPDESYPAEESAAVSHGDSILFGLARRRSRQACRPRDCSGSSRQMISSR